QARQRATIDVATRNRTAPARMRILRYREHLACGRRAHTTIETWIADAAFHNPPTIVSARRDNVYLFARSLAHIAEIKLACAPIKRVAPWVALPICVYLIGSRSRAEEGIGRR